MKVEVTKPVTLTLKAGCIIDIDATQLSLIKDFVKVKEEKKKKGE